MINKAYSGFYSFPIAMKYSLDLVIKEYSLDLVIKEHYIAEKTFSYTTF